jgi:hypothetical protein
MRMVDGQKLKALPFEVQQRPHLGAGLHAEPDRAVRRILDRPNPTHAIVPPRQDAARLFRQAGLDVIQHGLPVFEGDEQAIRQGHRRALYRLPRRFRAREANGDGSIACASGACSFGIQAAFRRSRKLPGTWIRHVADLRPPGAMGIGHPILPWQTSQWMPDSADLR